MRVTAAGYALLVAVLVEQSHVSVSCLVVIVVHVTRWMNVLRSCRNHTSHVPLSCAVVFVTFEYVIERKRMCDKLRKRTPFNVICGKYSWMTSKKNRYQRIA